MAIIELVIITLAIMFTVSTICDTVHKIMQDKYYFENRKEEEYTDSKEE